MSAPSRRSAAVSALVLVAVLGPALTATGALLDGSSMVARVGAGAERSRSTVVVATTAPAPLGAADVLVAEVARLTNVERAAAGLPPVDVHPAAASSAAAHSADQAAMRRMSHIGSDGSDAGDRLTRAGFTWRAWGENVAFGQQTAAEVVGAWMGSPAHRANILNATFTTIGIGVATSADGATYWTMVLAA